MIAGTADLTLATDDYPGQTVIDRTLAAGDYTVTLADGWQLLRETSNGDVPTTNAVLLSSPVKAFTIVSGQVTQLAFSFEVDGQPVSTGGTLEISIDVTERVPDAGGPAPGTCTTNIDRRPWTEIGTIPPSGGYSPDQIQGMEIIDSDPTTMIVSLQNVGASCGGGTPATMWRVDLDPTTGLAVNARLQQVLGSIQRIHDSLFESSDGTLFTGGGWCGYKPGYYSTDHGLTFATSDSGTHPPNEWFTYAEFKGSVYLVSGYSPYHCEVYRWLGNGSWSKVFDIAPPRGMPTRLTVFNDQLFVPTDVYGPDAGCATSVPVYVTADGVTFSATTGIPNCDTVPSMQVAGGRLYAFAWPDPWDVTNTSIYVYDPAQSSWSLIGHFPFNTNPYQFAAAHDDKLYTYGTKDGDSVPGIYSSADAINWTLETTTSGPALNIMNIQGNTLYGGSISDGTNVHMYALGLCR